MRRLIFWLLAGLFSTAITVLAFLPAAYLNPVIEKQTGGRFSLGDAQGTVWQGSAFVGIAPAANEAITPLLPGRFSWHISPLLLLGSVEIHLANPDVLSNPVFITGSWREFNISPAEIILPAERLVSLGAPLNTIQPSGKMRLSWHSLTLIPAQGMAGITGQINLAMQDIASRLSPVKPLGNYDLNFAWRDQVAAVSLTTEKGPMLLEGAGTIKNGHLQFSGTAQAAAGQEEKLANLLNLLGQSQNVNGKTITRLEFK
ncbi:MAG: type II secretion system protein N [Sideroxydans sp.]|jgi:general secretion pathway protein N